MPVAIVVADCRAGLFVLTFGPESTPRRLARVDVRRRCSVGDPSAVMRRACAVAVEVHGHGSGRHARTARSRVSGARSSRRATVPSPSSLRPRRRSVDPVQAPRRDERPGVEATVQRHRSRRRASSSVAVLTVRIHGSLVGLDTPPELVDLGASRQLLVDVVRRGADSMPGAALVGAPAVTPAPWPGPQLVDPGRTPARALRPSRCERRDASSCRTWSSLTPRRHARAVPRASHSARAARRVAESLGSQATITRRARARSAVAASRDHVPGRADRGDAPRSSSSTGRVHGIRTNRSSPPSAANTGPGATMTPCRSAAAASAVPSAPGELAPQRQPARRDPERPVGECARDARRPGASRCSRSRAPVVRAATRPGVLEQPEQDQLLEHRRAEVEADPGVGQPVHLVVRGADPAEPQAAPERLARAADGDRVRRRSAANGRGIACPSSGSAWCGLVDDRRRVRARRSAAAYLSRSSSLISMAGGVLEVRDQVGQPRRGLAQRGAATASRSQPSGSTGEAASRAPALRSASVALG